MNTTFRVLIERHHSKGGLIGAGTHVVQAADKGEAARIAVAETVEATKAKNAKLRASRVATGTAWSAASEDPGDYVVKSVRKVPQRRAA
jgi:hypothetical protein